MNILSIVDEQNREGNKDNESNQSVKIEENGNINENSLDNQNSNTNDEIQIKQEPKHENGEIKQEESIKPNQKVETTQLRQEPMHEIVGGSSIRRYLNQYLTKDLLDGLKEVGKIKPEDPLRYLGEYLITKSNEQKKERNQI